MKLRWSILISLVAVLCSCDRGPAQDHSSSTPGDAISSVVPITNMVLVSGGSYVRQNQTNIIPRNFWIGKFEVTQAEYIGLTAKNPSHFKDPPASRAHCPAEKVSFNDAVVFCAALTQRERAAGRLPPNYEYRLPWEIEWEYACLAGATNRFSFGDSPDAAGDHAWTAENADATTHPVGQKKPNAWGLYDMHGNVWEWCLDTWKPEPGKPVPPRTPRGELKIFKGGGWNQDAEFAAASSRFMMSPSNGIHFVGFRIVLAETR